MNENLRVNSKTDILEFKRKHNLLVENGTIKANASNIKTLSNDVINNLRCGDVVLKEDASGKHAYLVSFKSDTGLCLTYCDAYCVETQSYDKSGNNWVYNSQDLTIIAEPSFENITDKDGHKRFIEDNITMETIEGVTQTYGKWSLSGSHLMIVITFSVENGINFPATTIATVNIPSWIVEKIVNVFVNATYVCIERIKGYDATVNTQELLCVLRKTTGGSIEINTGSLTLTSAKDFRVEFDLLIDNE